MEHFLVLGLQPGSSNKEIKDAYRKLAMQFHPDRTGGSSYAEARFKEINAAYKALTSRASARHPVKHQASQKGHQSASARRDHHSQPARQGVSKAGLDYSGFLAGLQAINKRFDEVDVEIQKAKASFGRFDELLAKAEQAWSRPVNRAANNPQKSAVTIGDKSPVSKACHSDFREKFDESMRKLYGHLKDASMHLDEHQGKFGLINKKTA